MWQSVLHDVSDKHTFKKLRPKYPKCMHRTYTKEERRRKKWIKKDSAAYNYLEKIINDKRTLADLPKLSRPYHTGNIEVFNSVVNMYAPKRKEFDLHVMDARVKLAAIDFNENVNREQSIVKKARKGSSKEGEKKWKIQCARQSKDWVAKEVKQPKSFKFIAALMNEVLHLKESGIKIDTKFSAIEDVLRSPKNIAPNECPEKATVIGKRESLRRFKR